MRYIYIGTDPGVKGGICVIDGKSLHLYKMPRSCPMLLKLLKSHKPKSKGTYVIHGFERLWPRMQRSATSTFRMGIEAGSVEMAHWSMRYQYRKWFAPPICIAPQTWHAKIDAPKRPKGLSENEAYKQHKADLHTFAQNLFPSETIRKDLCDAVLIAHYLKKEHESGRL